MGQEVEKQFQCHVQCCGNWGRVESHRLYLQGHVTPRQGVFPRGPDPSLCFAWQWLYSQRWASIGYGKLVVAHGAGDSQHLQPKEEQVDAGVVQGQERCVPSAGSAP